MKIIKVKFSLLFSVLSVLFCLTTPLQAKQYSSTRLATTIIELYTSEGCSSCPPADQWLRQLKNNPNLFNQFIPLGFHVDYWNRLGWPDRFSNKAYSQRQYQHQSEGNISQVYTPGFVVNNNEWRGLQQGQNQWPVNQENVGILSVNHDQVTQQLTVKFASEVNLNSEVINLNIAILGMNISTHVKSGENEGRILKHDFVVLSHQQRKLELTAARQQSWHINILDISHTEQQRAIVFWLSLPQSQRIIQATGGYL